MRALLRNQRRFYYANYEGNTEIVDEYGNKTGEYEVKYSKPIEVYGNISAAQGEMQTRQFGESEIYDRVIQLSNPKSPIDEHSVLWIDVEPNEEDTLVTPYDYVVKKVARSLNSTTIAITKVTVR